MRKQDEFVEMGSHAELKLKQIWQALNATSNVALVDASKTPELCSNYDFIRPRLNLGNNLVDD